MSGDQPQVEGSGENIFVYCEYQGDVHVMTVTEATKLEEMYSSLAAKWDEIKLGEMKLQYQIPTEKLWVRLFFDRDIVHMVRMHIMLKATLCKMEALPCMSRHASVR